MSEHAAIDAPSNWDIVWRIRLSALYHLKRERFLDGVDKASKAVSALGGAAAFSQVKNAGDVGLWITGTITVVATLSLVYGPSAKARKHSELARDFKRIEAEIISAGKTISEAQLSKFESQFLELESSEPASLGALVTQCHNELSSAIGEYSQITPLPFWQRFFKNWFDIDQTVIPATVDKKESSRSTIKKYSLQAESNTLSTCTDDTARRK